VSSGDLSLRDALSLALLHNPGLAADSWEVRAREAESVQAGLRPNPELALEVENFAGSGSLGGFDGVETTLALSQVLELGGKRANRVEEARFDRDLAAWDYEVRRIDVLTRTAKAFVEVLAAQDRIALADTLVGVAEDVLASVSRRVKAGGVSPVEERRARVSLEISRVDRDKVIRALDVARARLSTTWGASTPAFDRAVGRLEPPTDREVPSLETLARRLEQSPEVMRWATELDRRRVSREVFRSGGVPDLTLGGGVRHFMASVFRLTIPY
jgi:cobalt-zinc-cadmium efflux system outer membrane protein